MVLKKVDLHLLSGTKKEMQKLEGCVQNSTQYYACVYLSFLFFPFWSSRGPVNLIKLFVRPYLMPCYNWPSINPNFCGG